MKIQKNNKKILLFASSLMMLLFATGYVGYRKLHNTSGVTISSTNPESATENIDMNPATAEEKQQAADNKQKIVEQDQKKNSERKQQESATKSVKPVITSIGQNNGLVEVSSFIPGIFEEGGTCKGIFTKNNSTVTKTVSAVKEGSATYCPLITATTTELTPSGSWSVTVSYSSNTAFGTSDAKQIEIN